MRILIINQPTNNRGDEAAHRSLVRSLMKQYPASIIRVVFFGEDPESVRQMLIEGENVSYVCIQCGKGKVLIPKFALKYGLERIIACLHPGFRKMRRHIKSADLVICAPGGICMGLFQNWTHIYLLQLVKLYKKPVAYYSRSFGPFSDETSDSRIFKNISFRLLKGFDFLSIRDTKTMSIADEKGLNYVSAIDTAFLDTPTVDLPDELFPLIDNLDFVVFVPNSLVWHPAYKNADVHKIDSFYLSIIDILIEKFSTSKIIMLPQLFNCAARGDVHYFTSLKNKASYDRVIVISESYSSDIQQALISQSHLVVGARYHSVVFAINNNIPFIALSYEHKVDGLLDIINKSDQRVDIKLLGKEEYDTVGSLKAVEKIIETAKPDIKAKNKANKIAIECFTRFCSKYNESIDRLI